MINNQIKELGSVVIDLKTETVTIQHFTFDLGGGADGLSDVRDHCAALVFPLAIDLLTKKLQEIRASAEKNNFTASIQSAT